MRTLNKTILSIALACVAIPAFAADAPAPASDFTLTGNIGMTSDYRYRGISLTFKNPAIQGGFDVTHSSGLYIGTWASNVSSTWNPGANIETDWYGGYRGKINDDLSYDIGAIYVYYPGGTMSPTENTWQAYAGATWKWLNVKYTQDLTNFFGVVDSKGSNYLEANATVPLPADISLVAHYGHQTNKGPNFIYDGVTASSSIDDWKIGVSKDMVGLTWSLAYIDTNRTVLSTEGTKTKDLGAGAVVVSVGKTF